MFTPSRINSHPRNGGGSLPVGEPGALGDDHFNFNYVPQQHHHQLLVVSGTMALERFKRFSGYPSAGERHLAGAPGQGGWR